MLKMIPFYQLGLEDGLSILETNNPPTGGSGSLLLAIFFVVLATVEVAGVCYKLKLTR